MTDHDNEQIRKVLQQSLPPFDTTLHRDLWPLVLRTLEDRNKTRVPWYDWALIAVTVLTVVAFPRLLLVFAYHL
ncbi:MAG: hypothetical protein JO159_03225 [Acidobacteria bacterium]|nr:hypothetical protein [Acidobacteriota bacterium]